MKTRFVSVPDIKPGTLVLQRSMKRKYAIVEMEEILQTTYALVDPSTFSIATTFYKKLEFLRYLLVGNYGVICDDNN